MKRISMNKIREIIRLNAELDLSRRKIAENLNISRPVVSQYLINFKKSGLKWSDIKLLSDDALLEALACNNRPRNNKYEALASRFEYFTTELKKTGVKLHLLWEEYKSDKLEFYSYSQFCYHYQVWRNASQLTVHIDHKAGDKMFCDFTGKHMQITDWLTGVKSDVEVFVAVLGASQLTYVEAVASQQKEDWINANENSLFYFGGVPAAIVPDNLKSAVTKADKYEPDINPAYHDFSMHYNTVILPARPYKPKDKSLAENAVGIVYSWIFAKLRSRTFYSLAELNAAIREELELYNNKPMQRLKKSRRQLFNELEKDALKPLPKERYEIRNFEKNKKVAFNYHLHLKADDHYYSVPYKYRNKRVDAIYTVNTVEIYHKNIRIAIHRRTKNTSGTYSTLPEHRHPKHKWLDNWSPERFMRWAAKQGNPVKEIVEIILNRAQYPEQSFKTCLGILHLEKKYPTSRVNKACKCALSFQLYSYKGVKNILDNGLENFCEQQTIFPMPAHENIRGKNYYKQKEINK